MSEWWTYSPSSFLLFSPRTYYRLFELTNEAVWPLQIVALALGLAIIALILRGPAWRGHAVAAMLAACWLFVAWAYLLERYDSINWAARYFAIGFALQAALLAWTVVRDRLRFDVHGFVGKSGIAMIVYAVAIHPLIAPLAGRPWTQAEIFGLAPDPTAIATLGVLLAATPTRTHLVVLPLLWCAVSGLTLWTMEQPEALAPLLAVATIGLAIWKAVCRAE